MSRVQSICVFCGSRLGNNPLYAASANALGTQLAKHKIKLVYGGGNIGLMGVVADAVLAGGGQVIGVIPESLQARELAHAGVQKMHVVDSMHARKAMMAELSDGFIALPGGMGTFEELCEILTWAQLEFHHKPIGLLNVNEYYSPFLKMIDDAVQTGFISPQHRNLLRDHTDVNRLLEEILDVDIEEKGELPTELL